MNEHTPGPWEWSNVFEQVAPEAKDAVELVGYRPLRRAGAKDGEEEVVSILFLESSKPCENAADARLIAAAPDMLDALKAMVRAIHHPDTMWGGIVTQAEAAIAKATLSTNNSPARS